LHHASTNSFARQTVGSLERGVREGEGWRKRARKEEIVIETRFGN
jgi:hypothetical protein